MLERGPCYEHSELFVTTRIQDLVTEKLHLTHVLRLFTCKSLCQRVGGRERRAMLENMSMRQFVQTIT